MAGIADRLFGLGKAKAKRAARGLPELGSLLSSLPSAERQALERASRAAERCKTELHGDGVIDPAVLDDVGGAVDALMDEVRALADRIVKARAWLRGHDPEKLAREAAMVELEQSLGEAPPLEGQRARGALGERARLAAEVEQGLPRLAFRLQTAARELEALQARLTAGAVNGLTGAEGLLDGLEDQRAKAERALDDWASAARELERLS